MGCNVSKDGAVKKTDEPKKEDKAKAEETAKPADNAGAKDTKADDDKQAADKKAKEEKEAAEKKAKEEKEAAEKKAKEEKEAAEKKAKEEKEAAEKKAAEEKKKADEVKAASDAHRKEVEEKQAAAALADQKEETGIDWVAIKKMIPATKDEKSKAQRKKLFKQIDANGNGYISLSELIAGVHKILNYKDSNINPAIKRAYHFAKDKGLSKRKGGDDYVEFREFRLCLLVLRQYFEYFIIFDKMDANGTGDIQFEEFKRAIPYMKSVGVEVIDAETSWKEVNTGGGDKIMFSEFIKYATEHSIDLQENDEGHPEAKTEEAKAEQATAEEAKAEEAKTE